MTKHESLTRWNNLEANLPIAPHFMPVDTNSRGSRYGACGIRIDGNPAFIDAVLSRLKDLLDLETREQTLLLHSRAEVKPTEIKGETKTFANADENAEVCYIRLGLRGRASYSPMHIAQRGARWTR